MLNGDFLQEQARVFAEHADVGLGPHLPPELDLLFAGGGVLESVLGERFLGARLQREHRPVEALRIKQRGAEEGVGGCGAQVDLLPPTSYELLR